MKRKYYLIGLLILLVLAWWLYQKAADEKAPGTVSTPTATDASLPKGDAVVTILSVNDMHAAIDLMPRFAALVDSLRGVYPDLLVFSAGDNRTGNPINDQYDPVNYPMIAMMNQVSPS